MFFRGCGFWNNCFILIFYLGFYQVIWRSDQTLVNSTWTQGNYLKGLLEVVSKSKSFHLSFDPVTLKISGMPLLLFFINSYAIHVSVCPFIMTISSDLKFFLWSNSSIIYVNFFVSPYLSAVTKCEEQWSIKEIFEKWLIVV